MMEGFWALWSVVLALVGVVAAVQDRRRLAFEPLTVWALSMVFLAGVAWGLVTRPGWSLALVALLLWGSGYGREMWGWPLVFLPPLTPIVLTAASVRREYLGLGDLLLFIALCLPLPWWGPWLVAAIWHVWLLVRSRREALIPATPGLLLGGITALLLALV